MYTTERPYLILSMKLLEQFHYAMNGPCLWYFSCKKKYSLLVDSMCWMVHCPRSNPNISITMLIYFNAHDGSRIGMQCHSPNILPYFSRRLGYFFMWIVFMWMPLILVGATNPHLILPSRCRDSQCIYTLRPNDLSTFDAKRESGSEMFLSWTATWWILSSLWTSRAISYYTGFGKLLWAILTMKIPH